eukprot:1188378-Prorocentrum_minimum.AAC.2
MKKISLPEYWRVKKITLPEYWRVVCESPHAEQPGSLGDPAAIVRLGPCGLCSASRGCPTTERVSERGGPCDWSSWPQSIDDSLARRDWGWQNDFDIDVSVIFGYFAFERRMSNNML